MLPVKINDNQREGLAKVADNLATAAMVAIFAGGVVDNKIGWKPLFLLLFVFFMLLYAAFSLRREREDENGN